MSYCISRYIFPIHIILYIFYYVISDDVILTIILLYYYISSLIPQRQVGMDARRAQMELLAKVTEENDRLKKDLSALKELHEKEKKNLQAQAHL